MMQRQAFMVTFLTILYFSPAWSTCIFIEDCSNAMKYIKEIRQDPETIRILQKSHCFVRRVNDRLRAFVNCSKVPEFEHLPGGCLPLTDCPAALELKKIGQEQFLDAAACGYNGRRDMIICDNLELRSVQAVKKNKTELLPKACGSQAPSVRIVGGKGANFEDFPWIALLKYKNESSIESYRCHGSLISKRYIVTAAHCLKYHPRIGNLTKIVLGEYDITKLEDCSKSFDDSYCTDPLQEFTPAAIHVHPNFPSMGSLSDIGLVRLNRDAHFTDFIKPICLPLNYLGVKRNERLLIGGWGKTENSTMSIIKLKAVIKYLTNDGCTFYGNIDHTQICAGSETGADTCKGDSGGPLMVIRRNKQHDAINILLGVVSWGAQCGSGAAIYTNVTVFVNWILDTINE